MFAGLVVGSTVVGLVGVVLLARALESVTRTTTGCPESEVAAIRAAADGDLTEVQRRLDDGWDVGERDGAGNTALACAGPQAHVAVVDALLGAGADPNTVARDGDHVLADAARFCQAEVAERLLAAGARPDAGDRTDRPALEQAVAHGDLSTVTVLLAGGADPGVVGERRPADAMSPWGDERGPACGPAGSGQHDEVLAALLAAGADPGVVLDRAAAVGAPEAARAALAAGADPDVGHELVVGPAAICSLAPTEAEALALGMPSCASQPVAVLLGRSGQGSVTDSTLPSGWVRRPPLLSAAWRGDGVMVELLLAAGAHPNAASSPGFTALHAAAAGGHTDIEARLVAAGAVAPPGVVPPDQVRTPTAGSTATTLR